MDCLDDKPNTKGKIMSFLKKAMPYILGLFVGGLLIWFFFPKTAVKRATQVKDIVNDPVGKVVEPIKEASEEASNVIIQEMCPEPKVIIKESPPEIKTVVKWKEKIVYKDRIVYKEPETKVGCHVDWKTGQASGYAPQGTTLVCNVDYKNKKIDEKFYRNNNGMLRVR